MKIVVLDGHTLNPGDLSWERIASLGDFKVYDRITYDGKETAKIIGAAKDADVVFTNKTPLNAEVIEGLPRLKYIGVLATGYNIVDADHAKKKGITVTNIPAYSTPSVAQMTFALLLEICFHAGDHNRSVKQGRWSSNPDFCFWDHPLIELAGKTFGVIGYGKIGRSVAKIAAAFGMEVLVYNRSRPDTLLDGARFSDLENLYRNSDIISLHLPLFPETEKMIDKEAISKMKDKVIILNTSRGGLIDENDMADALNTGKVGAFGADVLSVEPAKPENPLLKAENTILTPHIAWAPKESRIRLMDIAYNNLLAFKNNRPVNVVNP